MPDPQAASTRVAPKGVLVPLTVRVEGLMLGSEIELMRGSDSLTLSLNGEYTFAQAVEAGVAPELVVSRQPAAQECAVSTLAPALVPADEAPVFVICRSLEDARVHSPATLPDGSLQLMFGAEALRPIAYPGIPYEARPGVTGGQFPYEFRLLGVTRDGDAFDPQGVSLDFRHGTVRFTPPGDGEYRLSFEIRDSATPQRVLTHEAVIDVSASHFAFVELQGEDSPLRGAIDAPFRTPEYALAQTNATQALLLRAGRYPVEALALDNTHARQILAYPDEVAVMDLQAGSIDVRVDQPPVTRLEGLDITGVLQYGIHSDPSSSGLVLRRLRFLDGEEGSTPSENPAFIHARGDADTRHRLLVQDNDFGPFVMHSSGAYALTLYDVGDSLIENNQIRVGATTGGIHDKDNSQRNTYRENIIAFEPQHASWSGIQVSAQANSERVHIHHNLLINAGLRLGLQCFQDSCYMREHDAHHNTLAGAAVTFGWGLFNPTSSGTRLSHNIVASGAQPPYAWHSCLATLPAAFASQIGARHNLIASSAALAMRDTECAGSPMNQDWATWQDTHGLDTAAGRSLVAVDDPLVGADGTLGLPEGDARRPLYGHLYRVVAAADALFADGFEP